MSDLQEDISRHEHDDRLSTPVQVSPEGSLTGFGGSIQETDPGKVLRASSLIQSRPLV